MVPPQKVNLDSVITARLEAVGADRLPVSVRRAINADVLKACTDLINQKIDRDYVGNLVKRGLEAPAANGAAFTGGAS